MTTKEILVNRVKEKIKELEEQLASLTLAPGLDKINIKASFFGHQIDFDNLKHDDVIKVIEAVGGNWNKIPGDDANVHYSTTINGISYRCYNGEPPPNCKIVEVLETIPAQPERVVTRRKLVCQ